ncbi:MAG TPA: amidohydrolase family protein [Vicinamibacterales bacterium]|nr:amidohydrolase family protein [Vicinamibacterales bacterium]
MRPPAIAFVGLVAIAAACSSENVKSQLSRPAAAVLYEGARLIPGDGREAVADSAFLVENGAISQVGKRNQLAAPSGASRVDLSGKTVIPALINTHGHPGFQRGLTYGADNFTRETIIEDLNRALYFGVSVVLSQGIEKGDVTYQIRAEQEAGMLGGARLRIAGRGIGAPNAGPGAAAYAGIAYEVTTEDQARKAVRELAARRVNVIKIWVDDRNGRAPRLASTLFRAIIDEGHQHGLPVNAHVFYHADAVELVEAGIDALAHLVRDKEMDDGLVAAIVRRNVYVMPNLSPERNTHAELPHWLKNGDPLMTLLQESTPAAVIERMTKSYENRDPVAVERTRSQYAILQRSLAKLAHAGAKIVLGSDTGLEDLLFGMAEHRELESMVGSGMSPMQAIVAATSRAAEYLKLNTGALLKGKDADFLVLDGNPLEDITHTQRIADVYVKGTQVDRDGLRRTLVGN